jgi:hypothetical protein
MVFQQPAEPVKTPNRLFTRAPLASQRKKQHIALAVMSSLVMIMVHVVLKGMQEGAFTKEEQLRQGFSLHRFHIPPRMGI